MSEKWDQMVNCMRRLMVFYSKNDAHKWMCSERSELNGDSPAEAIRSGRYSDVDALIDQLESGAYT